jgi:predicted DCC family thiol-disulfide oxidoreductase YuxK
MTGSANENLVLYDGLCALCNSVVRILVAIDRQGILSYASLQGETAAALRQRHPEISEQVDTIVFVQGYCSPNERCGYASEAIVMLSAELGGIWRLFACLRFVPLGLRDRIYRYIARNRYRWFGKYQACPLPSQEVKHRFLP